MSSDKQQPIGHQVDALWKLREDKRQLNEKLALLDEQIQQHETRMLELMQQQGLDKISGKKATISLSTSTSASVQDWDSFYAYIHRHKYYHLLQRRVSDPAYRELLESGKKVPGVQPFNKTRLNLRSL